ncbi:hypothetical protein GGR56DRAFT_435408 [Xylariaceae sp. FL0804]|nr:hypothetical protein GGR56DRAFT_435408 [Xylariaceae sp. FL0804]
MGREKTANKKAPGNKKQQLEPRTRSAAATAGPSWPPFRPALPVAPLSFEAPIPALDDQILLLRTFWPKSLCRDYVSFLKELPLTTTPGRPKRGEAVRVNDRFQVDDPAFAQRLWLQSGLRDVVLEDAARHLWGGDVVGLNPNIRVYRYGKGQFFDCHYDDSNLVTVPGSEGQSVVKAKTTWTLLLYLTSSAEGLVGGETSFYPRDRKSAGEEIPIAPETGTLLLHRHGENCLLHEGREVLAGEKWILRSDICIRR